MAKFRMNELRQLHSKLTSLLEDYDEEKAAEAGEATAQDNPPEFPGKPAAQDSAPDVWASGPFGVKPKGLMAYKPTAASRSLDAIPGINRLNGKY